MRTLTSSRTFWLPRTSPCPVRVRDSTLHDFSEHNRLLVVCCASDGHEAAPDSQGEDPSASSKAETSHTERTSSTAGQDGKSDAAPSSQSTDDFGITAAEDEWGTRSDTLLYSRAHIVVYTSVGLVLAFLATRFAAGFKPQDAPASSQVSYTAPPRPVADSGDSIERERATVREDAGMRAPKPSPQPLDLESSIPEDDRDEQTFAAPPLLTAAKNSSTPPPDSPPEAPDPAPAAPASTSERAPIKDASDLPGEQAAPSLETTSEARAEADVAETTDADRAPSGPEAPQSTETPAEPVGDDEGEVVDSADSKTWERKAEEEIWLPDMQTTKSLPAVTVERPPTAVDPHVVASLPPLTNSVDVLRERAGIAANAARAAAHASQLAASYSAATSRAASDAATASSAAAQAATQAHEAAERCAAAELERAVERARSAQADAAEAEAAAAASAASGTALRDIAEEQQDIAEALLAEPKTDAMPQDSSEQAKAGFRLWLSNTGDKLSHMWSALCAWFVNVWSGFVNWTCLLGEHVKKIFFSGKSG